MNEDYLGYKIYFNDAGFYFVELNKNCKVFYTISEARNFVTILHNYEHFHDKFMSTVLD